MRDLPVAWVRRADGELSVELRDEPSDASGSAWCETGVGDIEDVVRQLVLIAATTQREVRVRDVRLTVTQVAPDVLVADGECRLSWMVLRLRLGARVTVGVAGSSIVVQALDVHSGNPLAAIVLRLLRRQIASAVGARLDLQDGVPASLTVSAVRLGVQDRRIRAEVVFGGAGG